MTAPKKTTTRKSPAKPVAADQDKPAFITFKGERFRLPDAQGGLDLDTMEAFELGRSVTAIRGLLGEAQYAKIKLLGATSKDVEPLFEQIAKVYGFTSLGESSASSD